MNDFDPFSASYEEAILQPDAFQPQGALQQCICASELVANKTYYSANPIHGIARCTTAGLPAPDWLARSFLVQYRSVTQSKVRTWDEAFGPYHKKGTNLAAKRRANINRFRVAEAYVKTIQGNPDMPIDKDFWAIIGESVGEGATRAEELYREAISMGLSHLAAESRDRLRGKTRAVRKTRGCTK